MSRRNLHKAGLFSIVLAALILQNAASSAEKTGGYAGLEFLGSSLISRTELEKSLHLHNGASYLSGEKALEKLSLDLSKRPIKANLELIPEHNDYYVAVDVVETGLNNTISNRKLENPHHINLPNEKPFSLLAELKARLQKLAEEGRPSEENYSDGIRVFSDVACMRSAELLMQELQDQKAYLFKILATDPNGERRADAAEMLNWTADPAKNCFYLLPALDDSDARVRMNAAKYIWARIKLLPDDFPFDTLLEGLSRQLSRPSHHDRIRAMAALLALAKRDSDSITGIKTFDEAKLKDIANNSIIPSVQDLARKLLAASANPPPIQRKQAPDSGSDAGF
ncbi:MAG: hypothetical protein K2X27_27545 [Candidatus Obscuribacterales bacterium]|nr:hypothetical protein [Candidatus Obscuribacterales bacterium]